MPIAELAAAILHILVLVYWLGGDIGVFYASSFIADDTRPPAARLMAGKILADLDLLPRFCLLLAVPTGLLLATQKGWLDIDGPWVALGFVAALAWIVLVIKLHLAHGGADGLKKLDTWLRTAFIVVLLGAGASGIVSAISLPLFIAIKLLLLGIIVSLGLTVRIVMAPFFPAFAAIAKGEPTEADNAAIKNTLARVKPIIIGIWAALIVAAMLGIATPT